MPLPVAPDAPASRASPSIALCSLVNVPPEVSTRNASLEASFADVLLGVFTFVAGLMF
jgi:hypothetical protein